MLVDLGATWCPPLNAGRAGLLFSWAKAFRAVRAVRLLNHIEGPRKVVMALIASLPVLFNIFLLIVLIWFPFAVIGVQLFKGSYWTCSPYPYYDGDTELSVGAADCPADHFWVRLLPNFDNVFAALRTAHILSTADGWIEIMWVGIDRIGPKLALVGPVPIWTPLVALQQRYIPQPCLLERPDSIDSHDATAGGGGGLVVLEPLFLRHNIGQLTGLQGLL